VASPLLANIALSALDEHFCAKDDLGSAWQREAHRRRGGAFYRIVRYADDFAIMVCGTRAHADALWEEVAEVLAPLGLRLPESKTRICHIDEGFDFLGFRIQRRLHRGTNKKHVYTYPSKKALLSLMAKVRALTNRTRHATLEALLRQLNPVLRGWLPTSGTACPRPPSATWTPSPGAGSPDGCASGTKASGGRISSGGS
jgi:RNA-directed DNA polymerase